MPKEIIAGNWKMYKTAEEAVAFANELKTQIEGSDNPIYLAVPFTAIQSVAEAAKGSNLVIGAQNMNDSSEGAFTGEIAAKMLTAAGAQFVILGHSERRNLFNETSPFVNRKLHKALEEKLQPIVCVGETKAERNEGKAEEVVRTQITESLEGLTDKQVSTLILAYESLFSTAVL